MEARLSSSPNRQIVPPHGAEGAAPSVLLSVLIHADTEASSTARQASSAHRVSLSDQRRSAPFGSFSTSPAVSLLVFEDGLSTTASLQTHAGPTANTQVKRLQNWVLEQEMQFPPAFTAHARVVAQPALSPAQLRSRRVLCYAHNSRDVRRSSLAACERIVQIPHDGDSEGLASLVAGAWALATPIIIFDDRYGACGFWDFLTETIRSGANYFAPATGIIVDVQMLAVPLRETRPDDSEMTVDVLWTQDVASEPSTSAGHKRKASVMCARDAAQLDVIMERVKCVDQSLHDRERPSHLVTSLLFFNQRTLRKASLTVVRIIDDDDDVTQSYPGRAPETDVPRLSSSRVLEELITDPHSGRTTDPAVRARYLSTRLTSTLHKKVTHFMRTKEYQNGALFHWVCNVPCVRARRLPAHLDDQRLIEFTLCADGGDDPLALRAAKVTATIQRVQLTAQCNATEFTLLEPKRSSLTAERLSVHLLREHLPQLTEPRTSEKW